MALSAREVIRGLNLAFANRTLPQGRIISREFDLSYHVEAKRVDVYVKDHMNVVDKSNNALVMFNYLTADAALWIAPRYMEFTVKNFEDDDFMILIMVGALASGEPGAEYTAQGDLGVRMRALAQTSEAAAVCQYLEWIELHTSEIGLDETLNAARNLWCA